jgi:Ca-activated chloride channel homolog
MSPKNFRFSAFPLGISHFLVLPCVLATAFGTTRAAVAQGLLIDIRPEYHIRLPRPIVGPVSQPAASTYKIDALEVNAKLSDQIAHVQVSQTFENTGSQPIEAAFVFPLPYDGAVDQLTLLVDGKEYQAKLLSKDDARRRYEEIVRKNRDPALLEWVGTGMFETSVFPIPPGAKRTVTLRYAQLCRQSHGLTDFQFPLSTAKYTAGPLDNVSIRVTIDSTAPIKNVYSATHAVKIERPDKSHAVVTYDATKTVPGDDFRLMYDSGDGIVGASVVSYRPKAGDDGYFLLLASPEIKSADTKPVAKTIVFAVDRSGSMSGKKIEQAKSALKFVLNNLHEGDTFNIVAYDSAIETFRPELQKFNDETRAAALSFVDGLYAGGSTNIDGALHRALDLLTDSSRPNYVIFLTDGLPTDGETGETAIENNSKQANHVRARLFVFGVGFDVNSHLLDKLARANFGQSEYVRPNEDIEAAVSKLYGRIGTPVMTDVSIAVDVDGDKKGDKKEGAVVNRLYPQGPFDLFAGDQAVIVGRYHVGGKAKVTLSGTVGDKQQSFDFPADLVDKSDDDTNAFVAKLWATRRVGDIIDQLDLKGRNEELVNELVALATEHGILTPYTSFLADETSNVRAVTDNRARAMHESEALEQKSGSFGFYQRGAKAKYQNASQAPAAAPMELAMSGRAGAAGGLGGGGGSFRDNVQYYDAREDRDKAATNIRQIGRKTFFQRGNQWVDSTVNETDEKSAQKIERYSRAYFDLVEKYGQHVAQYLALDDAVVIKLGDQTYSW